MKNSYIEPHLHLLKRTPELCLTLLTNSLSELESQLMGLLSPREREEGRSRTSPSARLNWLRGRMAAKAAAGNLLGLPLERIEVLRGTEGPPELLSPGEFAGRICLSISHTEGGALAAASFRPVGVDLEAEERKRPDRAWNWAFTEDERSLAAPAVGRDHSRRLAMWCAKEAAAKSWGLPLLNHLAEVRIARADWAGRRLRVVRLGENALSAQVELMAEHGFLLALALADLKTKPPPPVI